MTTATIMAAETTKTITTMMRWTRPIRRPKQALAQGA